MNGTKEYVERQLTYIEDLRNMDVYRRDMDEKRLLDEAWTVLMQDKFFLKRKTEGQTFPPAHSRSILEEKSEIITMMKKDIAHGLMTDPNWDKLFGSRDMQNWLNLYERVSRTNFKIIRVPEVEADVIVSTREMAPYGEPRNLEMLQDFLTRYMSYTESWDIVNFVVSLL